MNYVFWVFSITSPSFMKFKRKSKMYFGGVFQTAKDQRENFIGQTIPNTLLAAKKNTLIGGDFNCIIAPLDCTHHPESKMSTNLKRITTIFNWKDTFRTLHPNSPTYSHFYNRQMSGSGLTQGGSRLDRSYLKGNLRTVRSEYVGASFSDHMLHLTSVECPEASPHLGQHFKPYFKVRPEIAKDEEFQARVHQITQEWQRAKAHLPLLVWWDLLKKDIRQAAKQIGKERAKEKKSTLNFLMLAQAHLSKKVSKGELDFLPKLKSVQLQINKWFDDLAEKIKLHSRAQDMQESEKVRIFHYEQFYRTNNRSSITKLKTSAGIIEGHDKCAKFLNNEVASLFGKEVELDEEAQEELLDEVEPVFTPDDNEMLQAEISDEEVKMSLHRSNKKASPGCDGLTYLVYEQCWGSLGKHLCEVIREVVRVGTPSVSMQHSLLVFSPKPGKGASLLPRDKRRLSMLQSDWKVLTGVLAARLRKTEGHTLSQQQYAAGKRRINHAISQARDTVENVSPNQKGCALVEMDFQGAYDMLSLRWTWKVLLKKNCSPAFVSTMQQLYELSPSYLISTINNQQQPRILNKRSNIKQGDRGSTILYCFSTCPLLSYLQRRLQGIRYHRLATEGPAHPVLGPASPVEARLGVLGFVDDLKCGVSSVKESEVLDGAVQLFERSSGSKLHRDPTTKKCQLLPLGKWSKWSQQQSPLDYLRVVEEINFLGVILGKTSSKSRALNGDFLTSKVKTKIASYKAGRHIPLVCRPFTVNTYILSKLTYKASIFNRRVRDVNTLVARLAC